MAAPTPVIMTEAQFEALAGMFAGTQHDNQALTKLAQAALSIDRCDGAVPASTRLWVRALDGWATEPDVADTFLISLAKHTTSGDLLEEIRRWCNDNVTPVKTWPVLRTRILEHFLSACESLKLQAMLEHATQTTGESISAYVCRYRVKAQRAYPDTRAASEEFRVVSSFLRGFTDRKFAERLFRMGKIDTLAEVTVSALTLDAEREKMQQMLKVQGQEEMEVDSLDSDQKAVAALQQQVKQISARLAKTENKCLANNQHSRDANSKQDSSKATAKGAKSAMSPPPKKRSRPDHKWTASGQPICNFCSQVGHFYRNCQQRASSQQPKEAATQSSE